MLFLNVCDFKIKYLKNVLILYKNLTNLWEWIFSVKMGEQQQTCISQKVKCFIVNMVWWQKGIFNVTAPIHNATGLVIQ